MRKIDGYIIDDWFDKLQLKTNGDGTNGYHSVTIQGFEQGKYMFQMKNGNKIQYIEINVTKGSVWEVNDEYMISQN